MLSLLLLLPLASVIFLNLPIGKWVRGTALYFALILPIVQISLLLFGNIAPGAIAPFYEKTVKLGLLFDDTSALMLLIIGILVFCSVIVGNFLAESEYSKFKFMNLVILTLLAMNGTVLTSDLFSLYIFIEITAIASFILIAMNKDLFGFEGAFKYVVISTIATLLMLSGIAIVLMVTGESSFSAAKAALQSLDSCHVIKLAIVLFLVGLFLKSGMVPFHGWVPDAYVAAPPAVAILLAGCATKIGGLYSLLRVFDSVFTINFQIQSVLLAVGLISAIIGALGALAQNDMKRLLAYSSISQMGYILLGIGVGTPLGKAGALFHFFNHSILKGLLFTNSSAVENQTKTRDLEKLKGLGSRMPITAVTSVIGSLSTAGIPPLSGFWSKLIILIALWKAGFYTLVLFAALISLLTLSYFLSMQRQLFFGKDSVVWKDVKEADFSLVFPALLLASITVGVGVLFPYIVGSIILPFKGSIL